MSALNEQAERLLYRQDAKPCANPLEALQRLAGRALALEETIGQLVNDLSAIRYEDAKGAEQLRSEVAVLERAMDRAGRILVDIAKLNIDERLAAITSRQADAVIAALEAGLAAAGVIDPQQRVLAKAAASRELRLVR